MPLAVQAQVRVTRNRGQLQVWELWGCECELKQQDRGRERGKAEPREAPIFTDHEEKSVSANQGDESNQSQATRMLPRGSAQQHRMAKPAGTEDGYGACLS